MIQPVATPVSLWVCTYDFPILFPAAPAAAALLVFTRIASCFRGRHRLLSPSQSPECISIPPFLSSRFLLFDARTGVIATKHPAYPPKECGWFSPISRMAGILNQSDGDHGSKSWLTVDQVLVNNLAVPPTLPPCQTAWRSCIHWPTVVTE